MVVVSMVNEGSSGHGDDGDGDDGRSGINQSQRCYCRKHCRFHRGVVVIVFVVVVVADYRASIPHTPR
jgi:hypothetical protein